MAKTVVFLGLPNAGKTALVRAILGQRWLNSIKPRISTDVYTLPGPNDREQNAQKPALTRLEITEKRLHDPTALTLQVPVFNAPRLRSQARVSTFIYCIDLSNPDLNQGDIEGELRQLQQQFREPPIFLVGTKQDQSKKCPETVDTNTTFLERLKRELGIQHIFLTSAKTNPQACSAIGNALREQADLYADLPPIEPLPPSMLGNTNELQSSSDEESFIEKEPRTPPVLPAIEPLPFTPRGRFHWLHTLSICVVVFAEVIFLITLFMGIFFPPTLPALNVILPFLELISNAVGASFAAAGLLGGLIGIVAAILKGIEIVLFSKEKTVDHQISPPGASFGSGGIASLSSTIPSGVSPAPPFLGHNILQGSTQSIGTRAFNTERPQSVSPNKRI